MKYPERKILRFSFIVYDLFLWSIAIAIFVKVLALLHIVKIDF